MRTYFIPRYFLSGKDPLKTPHIIFQMISGRKGMNWGGKFKNHKSSTETNPLIQLVQLLKSFL